MEVKRPDEKLSLNQKNEITLLRTMGIKAGVFRLRENKEQQFKSAKGAKGLPYYLNIEFLGRHSIKNGRLS